MVKINLVGNILGDTGYASHTRQLSNALIGLGHEVRIETPLMHDWERFVNDAELRATQREYSKDMVTVCINQPPYWPFSLGNKPSKFFGFLVWEGDSIPHYWLKFLFDERVTGVLVPSEHTKQAIVNTWEEPHPEIYDKIFVVPHGVDTALFQPQERKEKKKYTFFANKGWSQGMNDRGGVQYTIKAFCEEFSKDEPVELKIKLNMAYTMPGWDLKTELEKLDLPMERPEVQILSSNVPFKELPKLYNDADCFVCSTRAEAFGLTGLEAKSMGLPTIQTDYGGQLDYMTNFDFKINYSLELVEHDLYYEGVKWATPDLEVLKRQMRACYTGRLSYNEEIRKEALEWTWKEAAKKLVGVIK